MLSATMRPRNRHVSARSQKSSGLWLYGLHSVRAALANPQRQIERIVLTTRAIKELNASTLARVRHEVADSDAVTRLLPPGAVHQGIALLCAPLPARSLDDIMPPQVEKRRIVLILDQITDPQNTGAILRSAAAFGVSAVVVQDRHAPPETGALAKAASGALDIVPIATVVNIARTLEELGAQNFWRIALAGDGETPIRDATDDRRDVALVLGSEGTGIRRLVREKCDAVAFIPIAPGMESLNVSNAAAVALYEVQRVS